MPESTATTVNLRPPMWLPVIVVCIGGAFYLAGKNMEIKAPQEAPMNISVSADAKVSGAPDIATLSFGVQTGRQTTAKAAIEKITKNMTAVLAAVKALGVEEKDISTASFWLNPVYDYTTNGQIPRGFEANQTLSVKVRDLDKVGDVLTAATNAGANQAGGVNFTIDNPDTMKAQSRQMAIEKAKAKAEVLARSLGMRLTRLTGFSEDGSYPMPRPYMMESKGMAMGDAVAAPTSVPMPVGEQDITSNVTLTYELR